MTPQSHISNPQSEILPDPAWEGIRQTIQAVRAAGRAYLFGQAWLGWQLATLKKAHHILGGGKGGDRKSMRQSGGLISWAEICKQECGLSDRTADRFIQLFESTQAKLKRKVKGKKADAGTALALFKSENPLALPPEQRESLQDVIASLCDGETQASLMQELGVVPKPKEMPKGGQASKPDDLTAGQLAFHFFEAMVAPVINARTNPDYKQLLSALPAYSTEENAISLDTIATECRALLADIDEVQRRLAKPARGKVIR